MTNERVHQGPRFTTASFLALEPVAAIVITPLVVGRAVYIRPATGLFAVVAIAMLFGPVGVLFAFPLTIVADIAIRRL